MSREKERELLDVSTFVAAVSALDWPPRSFAVCYRSALRTLVYTAQALSIDVG